MRRVCGRCWSYDCSAIVFVFPARCSDNASPAIFSSKSTLMKASIKNTKQNSRKHVGGGGRTYSLMEQFDAEVVFSDDGAIKRPLCQE